MAHLIHIDSSVQGDRSVSRRLTARAAERWRATHPGGTVTYRDLAVNPIPHLDAATGTARLVPADQRTPAQEASFAFSVALVDEIKNADTVLLGLPLYNFGPPSTVKAWVDHIVAPGLSIDAETGGGLLGGTDFIVLSSRGGGYGPGTPREGWDHTGVAATRCVADRAAATLHHRRAHDGRRESGDGWPQAVGRRKPEPDAWRQSTALWAPRL